MRRLAAVLVVGWVTAGPAAAAEVKMLGAGSASAYEIKKRFHLSTPSLTAAAAPEGRVRSGTWALSIAGLTGEAAPVPLELIHLDECGSSLGVYLVDGGKGQLNNGSLDQGHVQLFLSLGGHDFMTDLTKSGFGRYAGTVVDFDSGATYAAALDFVRRAEAFTVSGVTVSLNGTPTESPDPEGRGNVFFYKLPGQGAVHGLKYGHAGAAEAQVCYSVSAPDAGSVTAFATEAAPAIAMIYGGVGPDSVPQSLFVLGFTDAPHVQPKPRVISAFFSSDAMGIGVDLVPADGQ